MKLLVQRVQQASVQVGGTKVGTIAKGLLVLIGFGKGDSNTLLIPAWEKLSQLRIFPDEKGRFDKSLIDTGYEALLVSQFTLYGDTAKGRRPDFAPALEPAAAKLLYDEFVSLALARLPEKIQTGEFGAHMLVSSVNDGPVTFMIEF